MAKPAKKLKLGKATTKLKKKVRTVDLSATDDSLPPWDEDISSGEVIAKAETALVSNKKSKKSKSTKEVRRFGDDEIDDEDDRVDEEASVRFQRAMARVAKRVSNRTRAYNSPAVQELVTRDTLASVLRQLPKAERNYKASGAERAAYAYTNLINQVRDLMADLRAMSSTDALADQVIVDAVRPAFMQLVNYLIVEIGAMRTKITGASGDPTVMKRNLHEQIDKMLTELGTYADETLEKAAEDTRKALKV